MSMESIHSLAVVPIFVNAGTALLPVILAPLATVFALVLKPSQFLRACRNRPAILLAVLLAVGAGWLGVSWLLARGGSAARPKVEPAGILQIDWTREALEIIRKERNSGSSAGSIDVAEAGQTGPIIFRYGYARTGHDGGPAPLELTPAWEFEPGGPMFLSSPLVANGRLYGASCLLDVAGKFGSIVCLDAATGRPVWIAEQLDGQDLKPFFSSPALSVDGKYLIIGQGLHDDENSDLICLEAATGKLRWRIRTPLHIESSPAIHGDMAVVGVGSIEGPDRRPKGDPGFVLAVRISDGSELWRYGLPDPESSPAVSSDGIIYIGSGFQGNAVVALRSETDEQLRQKRLERLVWKHPTAHPVTGPITLFDDLVIFGGGNSDFVQAALDPAGLVAALDAQTGQLRWERSLSDAVLGAIAARDGIIICPVRNGELLALKQTDGSELWRQRISGSAPILAGPAFTDRHVYAVSRDGYLAVFDAATGAVLEKHYINSESAPGEGLCLSSPLIAGGSLFVGTETGGMRCFRGGKVVR